MSTVELFRALGEPTRLKMIERLSVGRRYTISSLSIGLPITRQGARKHIQILADAKIIRLHSIGRDTEVSLDAQSLIIAKKFIAKLESQWGKRLEALRGFIENG